ncbi:DUF4139 domain-containing protein [soil metagenome]
MRSFLLTSATLAFVALSITGCAATPQKGAANAVLPLRTLRLYETGVGYFERSGTVPTKSDAGLPVPSGHLDDALKTLVILSADGKARIDGVEFGSSLSHGMARAMAGLPTEGDETLDYETLLSSLKGSHVELRTPQATLLGRLVDVDKVDVDLPPLKDGKEDKTAVRKPPQLRVTIFTDRGAVMHVDGTDVLSVRPTDPAQAARIDAALASLLAHGAASHHDLRILGEPGAPITIGYIAETPVWRTSYRVVLTKDHGAVLQGWALLHNDTDEDWQSVTVELVNGRPDSFLFPLAAPRYTRRPLVTPTGELSTVPQLMGNTADGLWGDHVGDSFGAGGMGLTGTGEGGGGRGEGIGLGSFGTIGHGGGTGNIDGSSLLDVGDLAQVAQANGVEAGALFVYRMPRPVALRAHASTLVPFLQQTVEAEPIAWFDEPGAVARSAIRFVNSTTQTLPPGKMAIFADGGFAGESAIDRMRAKERRFLTFGADLDVDANEQVLTTDEATQRLTFSGNVLHEHFLRTTTSSWTLENRSGLPRSMYVTLALDRNATVTGADAIDFDAQSSKPLALFRLPAGQRANKKMTSLEGLSRSVGLADLTARHLTDLSALPTLAPTDKVVALDGAAKMKDVEDVHARLAEARADVATQEKDLARLRDDAKAVGDKGASAQPIVTRMVAAEDRLGVLRKRIDDLEKDDKAKLHLVVTALGRFATAK